MLLLSSLLLLSVLLLLNLPTHILEFVKVELSDFLLGHPVADTARFARRRHFSKSLNRINGCSLHGAEKPLLSGSKPNKTPQLHDTHSRYVAMRENKRAKELPGLGDCAKTVHMIQLL